MTLTMWYMAVFDNNELSESLNKRVKIISLIITTWRARCSSVVEHLLMVRWVFGFSFQIVHHNCYNEDCGMCYPVCGMVHIKESLLLIRNGSPCGCRFGFPLSKSE